LFSGWRQSKQTFIKDTSDDGRQISSSRSLVDTVGGTKVPQIATLKTLALLAMEMLAFLDMA
jgi:hypothetical protein